MILSRGRRYLFVHIPKTGGTSMALALEKRAMADDLLVGDTPKARRRKGRLKGVRTAGRLWKHSTVAEAEGLYDRDELDGLFVFTLVRNPWARMVSYYHWLRAQSFDHPAVALARRTDFSAFLAHPQTEASLRASPYSSYMTDGAGRERADLYIRLEHLEEDLAPLRDHLGFDPGIGRANASDRPEDWRSCYSDSDAERVERLTFGDIERFDYTFDVY
ncbi:sulfotransferase family 2 domain-containing protein [Histidinibacterium aquaticum]|uniref:Sulfotransferase family protein n=1 Tax=Histidinibacterium aquaticum TaxID=2613962 RepID=A0A5J5GJQ5_9RHOB|nr:sulfotransferase family 2 domain-containing protein [Histidinibacterium aquaticum]KAA9008300.1 sulfotransferase family protein [Histidinibacterium aquaticum]